MLIRSAVDGLEGVLRSRAGLWFRRFDALQPRHRNVFAVLHRPSGLLVIPASNIVTDLGDQYYAEQGAGETPTNFGTPIMELATAGTPGKTADRSDFTVVTATQKAIDGSYPQTDDGDADNSGTTGIDVVTWRTSWTQGDFTQAGITHGTITNTSPGASEPLLTGYAFAASFDKTADDTLKVFVNHEMLGV